jgi:hypothetical protein
MESSALIATLPYQAYAPATGTVTAPQNDEKSADCRLFKLHASRSRVRVSWQMVWGHDLPDRYHCHGLALKYGGEGNTYGILFPIYLLLAIHAYYITKKMPEPPI